MRNWQNPEHVAELAAAWNLDPLQIPSWAPPTHVMQMFRYAEEGSIRFLWISATNPPVADSTGVVETVRRRSGDLLGRSKASGLLLLKDLRALYLSVQAAEIAWVILVQAAKAARDSELLDTASSCHQEAETRGKWLRTRIKEASPQVLVAG